MGRTRYVPTPLACGTAQPFLSAEEAWMWFAQCQLARVDGVKPVGGAADSFRPCDPDDIYRAVMRLRHRRLIRDPHLTVLGRFGRRLMRPAPAHGDSEAEARLWDEALDRLTTELRQRGIVADEPGEPGDPVETAP